MPPGYHPIKPNASKVPAYTTKLGTKSKQKFAATQREAKALHDRVGPVEEDKSFRVKGGKVFDAETKRVRPVAGPRMVITGRHSKPRKVGGGDPVLGFLKGAADAVASTTTHYGKAVYNAYANPSGGRWGNRQRVSPKLQNRPVLLDELSSGMIGDILQAGRFFFKPPPGWDIQEAVRGIPKNYGKGDPWGHYPNLPKHLPEAAPPNMARGVGGRVPWLVHGRTGRIGVGNFGESHAEVGAKLKARGIEIQRKHPGDYMPNPETWFEGWLHPVHGQGQAPQYAMHLSTQGLSDFVPPQNSNQLRALINYITRDLKDKHVTVRTKGASEDATRAMMAARQGEARMSSLEAKLPQMTEQDFLNFLEEELKRKRGYNGLH